MILVTIIPLSLMATINYYQYQKNLRAEIITPLRVLTNKTKLSFELFLEERLSTLKFITSAYSYKDLNDKNVINSILKVLKNEFEGFVDLGLISENGVQLSYAGPYSLKGKDYSQQDWFQEVIIKGDHVSDVFMGYRKFPHMAIAVQNLSNEDFSWVLRATIDTKKFDALISSMQLDPESDAFLINSEGILQTHSRLFGDVLNDCLIKIPLGGDGTYITEALDPKGEEIIIAYSHFIDSDYTLVVVRLKSLILKTWFTFRTETFFVFIVSVILIIIIVFKLTNVQVGRIKEAEEKHELAFRELEHSQKLTSVGRLAAGVAHEINNPLAIIDQKAGLLQDIINADPELSKRDRIPKITNSILKTVERCRIITHRLLGFARRMDVEYEQLDLNDVVKDVFSFIENEAFNRNIQLDKKLDENLPVISSDRGQLQQVFLNILTNAYAAVNDGGNIAITTQLADDENVCVSIQDDGRGMSKEELKNIFEPFFTTKKGYGTGLGLSITYGIINKMGGKIKVKSKEGEGSTFTVCLPINGEAKISETNG